MTVFFAPEVADGEFLGDYQVLHVLGRGMTGTCYHVVSNVLGKEFVLKSMPLTERMSLEWIDRLEAQTAILSRLVHRHIDHIVNSGRCRDLWFCLKDFCHDGEGESCNLRQFRERFGGRLSHFQAFHVAAQLLDALVYAHAYEDLRHKGIFHGNLKPENVLVAYCRGRGVVDRPSAPFELKVSDFQPYALLRDPVILECYSHWRRSLVNYSQALSTKAETHAVFSIFQAYDYRAPELQNGVLPTAAADLFSVGVILYEALTGELPSGRFEPPSSRCPELPKAWDALLERCLLQVPELRYRSVVEMKQDLFQAFPDELSVADCDASEPLTPIKGRERTSLTPAGMVYVPAGSFLVGSSDCGDDALPQHECQSEGFYIDRAPVTNAQFAQFVQETGYQTEAETGEGAPLWIDGEWRMIPGINWRRPSGRKVPERFDAHPVTQVSYQDVLAYCEWSGRRLPTEQEWEYAARGGQHGVRFPWGNIISAANANYNSDGTSEVMQYPANGYGIYDMAGNVWEWTSSEYTAYPGTMSKNPHFGLGYRVVRGGSWMYDGAHCMVSYRNANQSDRAYPTLGFRTVLDFGG